MQKKSLEMISYERFHLETCLNLPASLPSMPEEAAGFGIRKLIERDAVLHA